MFKPIKGIAIIFLLSSCYQAKYTHQLKEEQNTVQKFLIANSESIVIFGDDLYVDFVNINEPESSVLLTRYGNVNNVNALKIRAGRYFVPYGLFYNSRLTACISQPMRNMGAILLGAITFGLLVPMAINGLFCRAKNKQIF